MNSLRKKAILEKLAALSFSHAPLIMKSTSVTRTAARSGKKSSHWKKRLRKWRAKRQRLAA